MGYDAVLLNTAVAKAADPVKMASSLRPRHRGWAARLRGGADRAARHGFALDPCRRHPLLQDRQRLLIGFVDPRPVLLSLDPFYPILPDTEWLARLLAAGDQARAAPHQGQARKRRERGDRDGDRALPRARLRARDQRLLARGDRARRKFRASRPGGSRSCRPLRHSARPGSGSASARTTLDELKQPLRRNPTMSRSVRSTRPRSRRCPGRRKACPASPNGAPRSIARSSPLAASRLDRAPLALAAGADSVAVITDIVTSQDPERECGAGSPSPRLAPLIHRNSTGLRALFAA